MEKPRYLPGDTAEILLSRRRAGNFALEFYRFLTCQREDIPPLPREKDKLWRCLRDRFRDFCRDTREMRRALASRIEGVERHLKEAGLPVKRLALETESPLVVGFGLESALEVGMLLHGVYGVPYLPASSLKGLLRAFWLDEMIHFRFRVDFRRLRNKYPEKEKRWRKFWSRLEEIVSGAVLLREKDFYRECKQAEREWREWFEEGLVRIRFEEMLEDEEIVSFSRLFGSQKNRGTACFSDFLPTRLNNFVLDVINCHFPSYYTGGGREPVEWENPVPVYFAALPKGVRFDGLVWLADRDRTEDLKLLLRLLEEALSEWGIGGKTAVGYGRLRLV